MYFEHTHTHLIRSDGNAVMVIATQAKAATSMAAKAAAITVALPPHFSQNLFSIHLPTKIDFLQFIAIKTLYLY